MQETFSLGYPFSPADLMSVLVQKMLLRDEPPADRGPRTLRSVTEASAALEQHSSARSARLSTRQCALSTA